VQELSWLATHIGSISDGVDVINTFHWDLSIEVHNEKWYVLTGSEERAVLFWADNRDAVDAFLYGMALAYAGIPSPYFEQLQKDIQTWMDSLSKS